MKEKRRDRRRRASSEKRAALTAFSVALVAIMLGLIGYVAYWYMNLGRIQSESERYAQLYGGRNAVETAAPTAPVTQLATPLPTATPSPVPTRNPSNAPTASPEPTSSSEPTFGPTPMVTPSPTPAITEMPTPRPTDAPLYTPVPRPGSDMPVVMDEAIPTPEPGTLILSLPTAPPVQSSFDGLLSLNPETVGFLDIEGMLSLPVAQRVNDNDYYLSHNFEGAESNEGALFLDGLNRLVPEDDCLIVYGHNMKNNTMFGRLNAYAELTYLQRHPVVHFDTLYENRSYVVFAAFTASMEPKDRRYFDVRQFIFDEIEFDKFVLKLQSRSMFKVPLEVEYGDRLLLLVTCDYTNREGRFILALRQIREDETEGSVWARVMGSTKK